MGKMKIVDFSETIAACTKMKASLLFYCLHRHEVCFIMIIVLKFIVFFS